ncbi:hypothetical protein SLS58_006366 [Diplodia intermedia]|uniref:NAD-dependent epimerase/dehydratase domain-containing protein n=1 Tax=Diplodia intermedia TaxID=856260 RepID=A0ABR3TNN9_9PEZI
MSSMGNKILLTGATGYVGGTVLDQLINSTAPSLRNLTFDLLVRGHEPAQKLKEAYGARVHPLQWKGLEHADSIVSIASNYDIIVNTGSGFVPTGAQAFVDGLACRINPGGPPPWVLHLSGCTNLSDKPLTGHAEPGREFDDADAEGIYDFIKREDERCPYAQRTAEVAVLTRAEQTGVQAVSLTTPCIFGEGTGLFNRAGLVVPAAVRYVVRHGYGYKLTETANFDWVHVVDLADLYVLIVRAILEREDRGVGYIPSGRKGIIFPAVARVLVLDIQRHALDAAFEVGVLPRDDTPKEKEIRQASLQMIADEVCAGQTAIAELGYAGHKGMKGTMAKKLFGWNPTRLEDAWRQDFMDELIALNKGRRSLTMDSCIGVKQK